MLTLLRTLGWIACVVYSTIPAFWLLIHPKAEFWRSRRRSPFRILLPLWIGMWALMAAITAPWRGVSLYENRWTWIPAGALFCAGLALYKLSHSQFSLTQLGGLPEIRPNSRPPTPRDHRHSRPCAPSRLPGPSLRDARMERGNRPGSLLGADSVCDPDRRFHDSHGG